MRRIAVAATVAALGLGTAVSATTTGHAGGPAPVFDGAHVLPGQGGGEPSIAVDLSNTPSRNDVYVEAIGGWGSAPPPGDPAGFGPVLWHSYDAGASFSPPVQIDTGPQDAATRGEDGDVVVDDKGHVIVTDLNLTYSWVQVSTDQGRTFNSGVATAPEADRPWLTADGSTVYVAYHDFTAELPVVCTSTDGGQSFPTCNPLTMTGPDVAVQCAENTIPARALAVDPTTKSLNFLFSCSTLGENLQHPPFGPLHDYYLAQSTDGGLTYSDYPAFIADTSGGRQPNYANLSGTLSIDSAGNYYALFAGTADDPNVASNPYHVYLVTSRDHGHTWSKPLKVDAEAAGTHLMPHMVVSSPGNVDVAWLGTEATGEPNGYCEQPALALAGVPPSPCPSGFARFDNPNPGPPLLKPPAWNLYMAQSTNALDSSPSFSQVPVTGNVHYGEICTNGIVCGSSDRTLLDFISIAVDCNGNAHIAFATNTVAEEKADFANGAANIRVANQVAGSSIAPPAACGTAPGAAAGSAAGAPAPAPQPTTSVLTALPSTSAGARGSAGASAGAAVLLCAALARMRRRGATWPSRTGG